MYLQASTNSKSFTILVHYIRLKIVTICTGTPNSNVTVPSQGHQLTISIHIKTKFEANFCYNISFLYEMQFRLPTFEYGKKCPNIQISVVGRHFSRKQKEKTLHNMRAMLSTQLLQKGHYYQSLFWCYIKHLAQHAVHAMCRVLARPNGRRALSLPIIFTAKTAVRRSPVRPQGSC